MNIYNYIYIYSQRFCIQQLFKNNINKSAEIESAIIDLTTFFLYLSKITSNSPENYLSKSNITILEKVTQVNSKIPLQK